MTALLPPNLLRLFAPRPPVPYLKPLVRDDSDRGPDRLSGISGIVKRLRDEAEEKEYKDGLEGKPTEAEAEPKPEDKAMDVDGADDKPKGKKKKDPIAAAGVIGQEAVKMRRAARVQRQAAYKKESEATCARYARPSADGRGPGPRPQGHGRPVQDALHLAPQHKGHRGGPAPRV